MSKEDNVNKKERKTLIDPQKKKTLMVKVMNYYYYNTTKIFKYILSVVSLLLFVFIVYIFIPTDTKNGVDRDNALLQTNIAKSDYSFNISTIPDKYTKKQTEKYIQDILKFIDKRDNQVINKAAINFVLEICAQTKNPQTEMLFNAIRDKVNSEEFTKKLDADNTVLKSGVAFCHKKAVEVDDNELSELEREKVRIEKNISLILEQRKFDKEIYGDAYDEETGTLKYIEENHDQKVKRKRNQETLNDLYFQLNQLKKAIEIYKRDKK